MPGVLCSAELELALHREGYVRVAGLDEAGRGCLFGPVYAAAVILAADRRIAGLADSKTLPAEQRESLATEIRAAAVAWAVASATAEEIDRVNIREASRLAMARAAAALDPAPDYLLIDALTVDLPLPQQALIKGDARVEAIAAASILAKTARDAHLRELDLEFPGYGFAKHKGYGTGEHLAALDRLGVTTQHRRSFAPVRERLQYRLA
ncbi:MAG: ribonuclease HII [Bryobacteraceae bacterium]|nr:ribonuclease HII [Bryobacteraceae bacterium]